MGTFLECGGSTPRIVARSSRVVARSPDRATLPTAGLLFADPRPTRETLGPAPWHGQETVPQLTRWSFPVRQSDTDDPCRVSRVALLEVVAHVPEGAVVAGVNR